MDRRRSPAVAAWPNGPTRTARAVLEAARAGGQLNAALGPECRRASGIGGMSPDLGRLAIRGVDDVDRVELKLLAGPFGADRGERDRMVIADQDVVQLRLNRLPDR